MVSAPSWLCPAAAVAVVALIASLPQSSGVELTFELPDNAKECFFEVIEKDTEATLEFQVRYVIYS